MKNIISIILFVASTFQALGETPNLKEYADWQLKKMAREALISNDYATARNTYKELVKKNPKNITYKSGLASMYMLERNYIDAFKYYTQAFELAPYKNGETAYNLAELHKTFGEYNEAIEILERLRVKRRHIPMGRVTESMIKNAKLGCELALSYADTTVYTEVTHLDSAINKPYIEYNPILINDNRFVYGRQNPAVLQIDDLNHAYTTKREFKQAEYIDSLWKTTTSIEMPFTNYPDFDSGRGAFSINKNRFYFTKGKRNLDNKYISHLYVTTLKNGVWSEPVALSKDINLKHYSSTQPTVGTCYDPNLEVVYFVSDRPNGGGGQDIWYTLYDIRTEKHSKPFNAGAFINTGADEMSPFFDLESHILYFSSKGWQTIGGFDIFKTKGELVNWKLPQNIGLPINSSFDDLDYCKNEAGNFGLFCSNRPGTYFASHPSCCDDIYSFKETKTERVLVTGRLIKEDLINSYSKETDEKETTTMQNQLVSISQISDSSSYLIREFSTNEKGEFALWLDSKYDYQLTVKDSLLVDKKIKFSTQQTSEDNKIELNIVPLKTISSKAIEIKNIYYEFGETALTEQAKAALDTTLLVLAKNHTNLLITITSHTDDVGDEKYNLRLSLQRANSVVNHLVDKGISKSRLTAKGFGESTPIAPNRLPNGDDNPEGRQKNRRTEFIITGIIDEL